MNMLTTPLYKEDIFLYKIKQNDTLIDIAKRITGSADNLKYLAVFNNLEPPYIVADKTQINRKASGYGKFSRAWITTDIDIPAGTIVYAPADDFTHYVRKYKTLSDTNLTGTETETAEIEIEAIDYGERYNITENKITAVEGFSSYPELSFINTTPLLNAKTFKVLEPGDYLLIPKSIISNFSSNLLSPADDYIDYSILGADIYLIDGDVVESEDYLTRSADINTAVGINNIKQALVHKLQTAKGSLELHPDYGSLLPYMLGNFSGSQLTELLRVETIRTLLTDPRVTEVSYVTVTIENNTAEIEYGVKLAGLDTLITDNLVFRRYTAT